MSGDKCPKCGNPTTRDEVDIGVGIQHGLDRCDYCGWSQDEEVGRLFRTERDRHLRRLQDDTKEV